MNGTQSGRAFLQSVMGCAGGCLSATVLVLSAGTSISEAQIPWRSAEAQQAAADGPAIVARDIAAFARGRDGRRHFVLHLKGPLDAGLRHRLQTMGVELLRPLGADAFFAVAGPGALSTHRLATVTALKHAEPIRRAFKLHPALAGGQVPRWTVVGKTSATGTAEPVDRVAVYAQFHADVPLPTARAVATGAGAAVMADLVSINALVLELPRDRIPVLADHDAVQWIEPPLPPFSEVNNENRALVQADDAILPPLSLDGTGINVMIYDGGSARATHVDFGGRLTVRDTSPLSNHSTHVAGTVGGDGTASGFVQRGMAPGVTLQSYGFEVGAGGIFLYSNPGDLEADYNEAINTFGVDISNNSIGTNTDINGFPCSIQGDYGITSELIDAIVVGSLGAPFRIIWAAGNERSGLRCDVEGFGDYYSIAPPSGAKNHISVGAINANDESMTSFSSWGPTDDGRLKPDITAPGCQVGGDGGVTSTSSLNDGSYDVLCGTSMATPTTTGCCALLLQDYRAQFPAANDPRNSTLKILLAHSAVDLGNTGPDYQFGYGSIRIVDAVTFMRTGHFFESTVDSGGVVFSTVTVDPGTPQLKVTLAWDDAPGTPNVDPALVNDLDLVVLSPTGVRAFPWTLDPLNPAAPAVRTQEDHVNNIEQVVVDSPEAGQWQVRVAGGNVPEGPQAFSLAASPNLAAPGSLNIVVTSGIPTLISPGSPVVFDVQITALNETIVPGSPSLHYRFDGGGFTSVAMTPVGGDLFQATLPPPPSCDSTPEFFFSAEGASIGLIENPSGGAASPYAAAVGEETVVLDDDFEAALGWATGAAAGVPDDDAATGIWVRVDPNGTAAAPEDDHSEPGTLCWVTGQGPVGGELGFNDVDSGKTTLVSPQIDLSDGDATISYWRWYSNDTGAAPNTDVFTVDISNADGAAGTWVNVETVGPAGPGTSAGWFFHEFSVSDFVTPSGQIRVRFVASDTDPQSLVEAAVDDFRVDRFSCTAVPEMCPGIPGDMDANTVLDARDVPGFVAAQVTAPFFDPCADLALPTGLLDAADTEAFVDLLLSQ